MGSTYKNEQSNIEGVISKLQQNVADYDLKIGELETLVDEIEQSSDWEDSELKPAFIASCKSYITIYKKLSASINKNITYMQNHNERVATLNQTYARRS